MHKDTYQIVNYCYFISRNHINSFNLTWTEFISKLQTIFCKKNWLKPLFENWLLHFTILSCTKHINERYCLTKNYCNPIFVVLFWRLDFMSLPLKLNECTMYYRRYKKLICLSKIAIWYCCYMYSINDTCFVYCRQNNWVFREGLKKRTQKHNPQALKQSKANGIKIR